MEAPVLSLKEVGADMTDELKMGNVVKVRVRNGLSTLRLSDNNLSSTSHGPVLPDRAGHLYKDLTSYKVSLVDYVYIVGKARVYVAELNCATKRHRGSLCFIATRSNIRWA